MPFHAAEARAWSLRPPARTEFAVRARTLALVARLAFRTVERLLGPRTEIATTARAIVEPPRAAARSESRAAARSESRAAGEGPAGAAAILAALARAPVVRTAISRAAVPAVVAAMAAAAIARASVRTRASIESPLVVMIWQVNSRSFASARAVAGDACD